MQQQLNKDAVARQIVVSLSPQKNISEHSGSLTCTHASHRSFFKIYLTYNRFYLATYNQYV